MLSKRATGNSNHSNGHKPIPPGLLECIPATLRETISESFEREGIMNEPAEQRIMRALAENHKETLGGIAALGDKLHKHDTRLVLVEKDVIDLKEVADDIDTLKKVATDVEGLKTSAKEAADERRNTSRLVKAAIVGSIMSIIIGALVSVYGTRQPVVQEVKEAKQDVKQDTAELTQQMKELIQVLKVKTEQDSASLNTSRQTRPTRPRGRAPEPVPGPGAKLRDGEMITTKDYEPPRLSYNHIPLPIMKVPE